MVNLVNMVKHKDLPLAAPQLLRLPQVLAMLGMSRSWLYAEIARGAFPPPVRLGRRAVAWRLSDIERWMAEKPQGTQAGVTTARACR